MVTNALTAECPRIGLCRRPLHSKIAPAISALIVHLPGTASRGWSVKIARYDGERMDWSAEEKERTRWQSQTHEDESTMNRARARSSSNVTISGLLVFRRSNSNDRYLSSFTVSAVPPVSCWRLPITRNERGWM